MSSLLRQPGGFEGFARQRSLCLKADAPVIPAGAPAQPARLSTGHTRSGAELDPDLLGGRLAELIGRREPDLDPGHRLLLPEPLPVLDPRLELGLYAGRESLLLFLTPPLTTTVESVFVVARSATFFCVRQRCSAQKCSSPTGKAGSRFSTGSARVLG